MLRAFKRMSCAVAIASAAVGLVPAQVPGPPTISSMSPTRRVVGDPAFTLMVSGSGFNTCTRVRWNGQDLTTSTTQTPGTLAAQVSQSLIANAGSATVTVFRYDFAPGTIPICGNTGAGSSSSLTFTILPPVTVTSVPPLPNGRLNQSYQFQFAATGGIGPPYTWSLSTGTLPLGMSLSSSGLLSGTPTEAGTFSFMVRAVDCVSQCTPQPHAGTQSYTLTVSSSLTIAPSTIASGAVCASYTQQFTVSGGTPPYSLSVTGLPQGLSFNSSTNTISGRLAQTGTSALTVRATDSANQQASQSYSLVVGPTTFQITTASLPGGRAGTAYSQTLLATGGEQPYSWSATTLPPGLSVSTVGNNGQISGTPTQASTFSTVFRVTDAGSCAATRTIPITIAAADLQISTSSLAPGIAGTPYTQTLDGTGGAQPYTWSITSTQIPGLTLSSGGVLSGTPTAAGTFPVTIQLTDNAQTRVSRNFQIVITAPLSITTPTLNSGSVGSAYSQTLQATGGNSPYSWTIVSGQAPGLTLSSGGTLSGTPLSAGSFPLSIQVSDSGGRTASRSYTVTVDASLTIVTTSLNAGSVGSPYSQTLQAAGGSVPYAWALASGQLPQGLTLSSSGVISGTPLSPGTFPITVQVSDSSQRQASRSFMLLVGTGISILTSALPPARLGQPYQQTMQATGGLGALTWSSLTGLPAGFSLNSSTGVLSGTPTATGDFSISFQVQDTTGATANRTLSLTVLSALSVITESLPSARAGEAYTTTLAATGGTVPYRWSAIGELPTGLTLDPVGVLSGTTQQTGSFNITVQVTDITGGSATKQFTLVVSSQFRITNEGLPNGSVGVFYNTNLQSVGGRAPVRWGLDSGQLPLGIILNTNTGALVGTPQQSGDFRFTIFATDADQLRTTRAFIVTIRGDFTITTLSLPNGVVGTAYSLTIATNGGSTPFRWSVSEGNLPAGLQLGAATGLLTGTPSEAGTFAFTIQAIDNANLQARQRYTLVIIGPPRILTGSLPAGTLNAAYTALLEATGGEAPYTWSQTGLPAGLTLDATTGAIAGAPTQAGSASATVTVTDRSGRSATRQFAIMVASGLTIVTDALPAGTVGMAYSQALQAAGGSGGFQWTVTSGTLPAGVNLAANGNLTGAPSRAGDFSFSVQVRDSQNSTDTQQLSIRVVELTLSRVTIRTASLQAGAGDQPAIMLELADPAPTALSGTVNVAFASDAQVTDPALQFSQGANPRFEIAQGSRTAVFAGGGLNLQLGTVAGTATITAQLTAGGVNVTPNPAPFLTIRIDRAAPVINTLTLTRSGNTLTVELTGFATSREVTSAEFQFAVRAGANVQGTSFTVPLTTPFTEWYRNTQSTAFGSAFKLTVPFNVSGAAADITGATVTLVNGAGRSQPRTGNF